MSFIIYDLAFLFLFTLFVIIFLYRRRNKIDREGILFLYRTKLGIKFINYIGKKYKRTLNILQYFSIIIGYVLMIGIIFIIVQSVYVYITFPEITKLIKAPPIAPVIPYFPRIFGLQSFFPEFYFTYFLVSILIVAVVHEFTHGFFARAKNLKIKSTGFAFIGPIIGAFVEPDEQKMNKKPKVDQLAILSGGVFANTITAIIFFIIMASFFSYAYSPAGVKFNDYSYTILNSSEIEEINSSVVLPVNGINLTKATAHDKTYFINPEHLKEEKLIAYKAYEDTPALNAGLKGAIIKINDIPIRNLSELSFELAKYSPNDSIKITTFVDGEESEFQVILSQNPKNASAGYLGIVIFSIEDIRGFRSLMLKIISVFKDPNLRYVANSNQNLADFIYYLFWWITIINALVALFNMLPAGIFDGGRFFFLTVLALTKSEKVAKKSYKIATYIILLSFLLLLVIWLFRMF